MRIDAAQVFGQGGVKIKTGTGTVADALKEGDLVRAGVVSSDKNGNVSLKSENGLSFNAKLGADVKLSPGDVILLEVTAKDKGQISLTFAGVETADEDLSAPQMSLVKDFTDKSLAPYASKLADLNMPVNEESARMMRELIAQNPGMKLEEAAFLASNKLTGDETLMKAALEVINGGDKTDVMIAKLLSLAGEQNPESQSGAGFTVNTGNATPLTQLLTNIVKSFATVFDAPVQGETPVSSTTQTIIAHSDANLQTNAGIVDGLLTHGQADNAGTVSQNIQGDAGSNVQSGLPGFEAAGVISQETSGQVSTQTQIAGNPQVPAAEIAQATTGENIQTPVSENTQTATVVNPETSAVQENNAPANNAQTLPSPGNAIAQVLSQIPQFSGTPHSALQRFSEMLLRVAGENTEKEAGTETLTAQLDKLFTRIGKDNPDAGARLRDARQELYARLALIDEAVSRAAQPARAELLMQTQKLMDHVRLLNSIDQFVYMQMPVQLNEERKAADLYVFKRKGKKNIDQDNVNILLAIDLEFMGHWEALVNIKNNKEVSIQMEVPGEDEKEHFNSHTVLLHNMLDDAGFKLVSTNIKFAKDETTPLTALSTFDRFTGGQQGIIDFKI